MSRENFLRPDSVTVYTMPSLEEARRPTREEMVNEAEEIQRQAYEDGFTQGERAGRAEGEQKAAVMLQKIEELTGELAEFRNNFAAAMESQVVELSVALARKIIVDGISTKKEVIVGMVREALRRLQRTGTIRIRINPALHDVFQRNKPGLMEIHEDIVFEESSNVPMTGPVVVSETEEVITDMDSLLSNMRQELKGGDNSV